MSCNEPKPDYEQKFPMICKFNSMGKCRKGDDCMYLHYNSLNEVQKKPIECPFYRAGFCKLGNLCDRQHTPLPGKRDEVLPVWYLEYLFSKPIDQIFRDFTASYPHQIAAIEKRISKTHSNFVAGHVLEILKGKVRYFIIMTENSNELVNAVKCNTYKLPFFEGNRVKEALKTCESVLFLFCDPINKSFNGFCRVPFVQSNDYFFTLEWLWKTKLFYSFPLVNSLEQNTNIFELENGRELSSELGLHLCRMMMNLASDEEIRKMESKLNEKSWPKTEATVPVVNNINNVTVVLNSELLHKKREHPVEEAEKEKKKEVVKDKKDLVAEITDMVKVKRPNPQVKLFADVVRKIKQEYGVKK